MAARTRRLSRSERLEVRDLYASDLTDVVTKSHPGLVAAIVNGVDSQDRFPSVGIVDGNCTGSLIDPRWVMTAAHCMVGVQTANAYFELGATTYGVDRIVIHPRYDDANFDEGFDLALLQLSETVEDIATSPILRTPPTLGERLTLVGFGQTGDTLNGSNFDFGRKQTAETPLESITDIHIGWTLDSVDDGGTAPGDSGGPAFVTRDGVLYIAGVTSGGDFDSFVSGAESFDTRIDKLAPYIDHILNGSTNQQDDHANVASSEATPLSFDDNLFASIAGNWGSEADADVFRIESENQIVLDIIATLQPFGAHPSINLLNEQGVMLTMGSGQGSAHRSVLLPEGVHYVSVSSDVPGEYAFSVKAQFDDQNSSGVKLDISRGYVSLNGNLNFVRGLNGLPADRDDFYFELTKSANMDISLISIEDGLDTYLRLYRANGDLVAFNNDISSSNRNSRITRFLPLGEYRVNVGSFQDRGDGPFQLTVSLALEADINDDQRVDLFDFYLLRTSFGARGENIPADVNKDGSVNLVDFDILRKEFGLRSAPPLPPLTAATDQDATSPKTAITRTGMTQKGIAQTASTESGSAMRTDFLVDPATVEAQLLSSAFLSMRPASYFGSRAHRSASSLELLDFTSFAASLELSSKGRFRQPHPWAGR